MGIEISSTLLARIMASAGVAPADGGAPHEKCGLLLGHGDVVVRAEPAANVSPTPRTTFEIDPAALLAAYRGQRQPGGAEVLGFFHTHPSGDDAPSVTDAACAAPDGRLWLIATDRHARLWRAVAHGSEHGRFVAVPIDLRTGTRVEKDVPGVQHRARGSDFIAVPDPESVA
ncbi:MAG: Mov34/MPN/PAD-1 family protein [Janthinobacterium lividum]